MTAILLCTALLGQASNEPRFVLHSAGDRVVPGLIEKMDSAGSVTMAGHPPLAGTEVIALRRLDVLVPGWPREPHLLRASGDRIVGVPVGIEGSFLLLRPEGCAEGNRLRFPLTSCGILWLRSPDTVDRDRVQSLLSGERADDQVIFRNGDVLNGVLTALDTTRNELIMDVNSVKRAAAIGKVGAVAFSTRLARVRKPAGLYWHLVLTNGTRLTLVSATIDKGELLGQTMYKDTVQVSLKNVAALDAHQGKAVYLSDLKPAKYEYRSYQGERHEWVSDRSLDGAELQLQSPSGITAFDKGLAMHGECYLAYSLDGKFQRFEAQVGLDPRLGKRGCAVVRVLVDGRETKINEGKAITLANGMLPVRVDVSKGKELKLVVEWGEGGHVGDCVNWGDVRLIP